MYKLRLTNVRMRHCQTENHAHVVQKMRNWICREIRKNKQTNLVWSKQIDALMWGEETKWQREEAADGGVRDVQGFYVKKTSSSERDKTQTEGEKDTLWKRGELICHPAFISCDLRVRAPTLQ